MKKVMKKFNRALSIMLVAAMVLTMAPQTAMPVLAAEPEVEGQAEVQPTDSTPAGDTTTDVDVEPSTDGDDTTTDTPADVTEPDSEGSSDISDSTDGEQEGTAGGEITGDTEMGVTDTDPDLKEDTTKKTPVTAETETTDEDSEEEISAITPDKLLPADFTVTAMEPDTSENAAAGALKALDSAQIVYTNGCVSADGKIRKDADITFKLVPKAGVKLGTVQYKTKGAAADATESALSSVTGPAADGTYTIAKAGLMSGDPLVNDKNVTIVVNSTEVEYTLNVVATGYKLYETKTDAGKTLADTSKEITNGAKKIKYSDTTGVTFALVADDSTSTKLRSVTAAAGDNEAKTLESTTKTDAAAENGPTYPIYTVKASDLEGIAQNDNQDITITVEADAAAVITISAPVSEPTGAVTFGAVTNKNALYGEDGAADGNAGGTAAEGQKVVFTATAGAKYADLTADDFTATFTPDGGQARKVEVVAVDETKKTVDNVEKTIPAHYVIDVSGETKNGTLAVTVKATLDDAKDGVQKVDFTSVSENSVAVTKTGSSGNLAGKTETTDATSYGFKAAAKPGYEIYQVEAVYDKAYKGQGEDGADLDTVTGYKETLYVAANTVKDGDGFVAQYGDLDTLSVAFSGTDAADVADGQGHAGKGWTTKNVTVNVYAKLTAVTSDKSVTIDSEYAVEVVTNDKIVAESNTEYTVKSGAEFFEFTVDAEAEPTVVAEDDSNNSILLGEPKQEENGGWSYKIAAGALGENQTITITRKSFDIAVQYDRSTVSAEVYSRDDDYTDPMTADSSANNTDTYNSQTADRDYQFIIEPEDNAKISSVSYTLGDSEEPEVVQPRGNSYVFWVRLSDDLKVTVETKDEYDLVVAEDGTPVKADSKKIYNVSHASTVTAQLLTGTNAQDLFNAEVKDGNAVAATIAKITDGNLVTLVFDESEYNKVLTVVLTLDNKEKTTKEFKVKTSAAAAEVSIAGVKGGKVDLPVDTEASYKLTVKTANASLSGIAAKVVPADDEKKADATAITAAQAAVGAEIVDGNLVITAKPAMAGVENAAKVIIVDTNGLNQAAIDALTVDNALKNGVVMVNTKNATIDGKSPTVSLVSTTDTTVKVKLGVPKGVVTPETGKIYYKVELTVPAEPAFPEGTSTEAQNAIKAALKKAATDWNTDNANLYQEKAVLDAQGGLLEIPVMVFVDTVPEALRKGVLMSGFSVKATLLQTLAADGNPAAEATTIMGGAATELPNIATKNPYYEVKLGLKKGTTNLITGQDKDVVIATPTFNKLTSYSYVTVEFVNTSTGELLGDGAYEDVGGNGSNVGYTDGYCGLYAKYDELQNAVIVNAVDAHYTNYNYHKNLGVKVTAYAEDSAYGAVATQKITVVNGIQDIDPSAPSEIYKQKGKAATLTVTTDLNYMSDDKKNAPKSKKLTYEIVDKDSEDADDLSAALKANVTVNNKGKVSINKNYEVNGRYERNQFKVKVTAVDYAGSTVSECTAPIAITADPLDMGTIAVFTGSENSAKLVAVNDGDLAATKQKNEYRVAVLQPGVRTSKNTYDLGTDAIDAGMFTFKSNNAKSVAVDENGKLTINKAAKNVKITVIPKDGSNKKGKVLNLKTVGQVDAAPALKISRYQGSVSNSAEVLYVGGATEIHYNGNSTNNYFKLDVVKPVTVDDVTTYEPFYLANYQISYKGGKQITKTVGADGDSIKIVANAKETTITLKNKAVRNAEAVVYKLVNDDCVTDNKAKAPKITTSAKLAQYTGNRLVSYTVKGQKTDDFTGNYVVLSADQTKKNPSNIGSVLPELDVPLPIILGQSFNLKVNTNVATVGNYSLVATVGSLENGVFKPLYKDAKAVVKITKQGKASLSVTGSYTLPLKNYSGIYLKYKSGNGYIDFTNSDDGNGNYAKNAIINGKENSFKDYFVVAQDYYGIYITLKPDLPLTAPANDPDAPALDKIVSDAYKNDRIGYISVNNGEKYIDVKLTITLKDETKDKSKYKVSATPVLEGPNAVTALTILDGKSDVPVIGILAESVGGIFKPASDGDGQWYLEAANLPAGNHKVDLYIVSDQAADAYLNAIRTATGDAQNDLMKKYGIKTSITVKSSAKTTGNKVVLVNKGSNKWTVADTDYVYDGWTKYAPFSFKTGLSVAANTNVIDVKATVNNKDVDYVTFTADKQWMTSTGTGNARTIDVPTRYDMDIKLDKAKLVAAIAKDAADETVAAKNKLNWGKTVKVKATFSYGADGPKADEVTFDIKLPANAGAADADVTKALTEAQAKLQSDIETHYGDLLDRYNTNVAWGKVLVNSEMYYYVETQVKKAIQNASVTVAITDNGSNESGTEALATQWTVLVKSTAAGTKELYNHAFVIPTKNSASSVVAAIDALTLTGGTDSDEILDSDRETILKVTASTTPAQFAAAVREALGAAATRNISITAAIKGETKAPTVSNTGSISFVLTIKDLSKKPSDPAYSIRMAATAYTLPKLDDLATCKNNVTGGLDATALTAIVKDAYAEVKATGATLDEKVKTLVVAKANELIDNNPAITVSGIAMSDAATPAPLFELHTPSTGVATDGTISFTLQLTEEGKTAEQLASDDYKLAFASTTLQAIAEFQTKTELLNAIKAISEIDYAADQAAALAAIKAKAVALSKNPIYNTADIVVEATTGETEATDNTVFTAPGEEADGSITKVVVKVGTAEDEKATIASVTVKKQATP